MIYGDIWYIRASSRQIQINQNICWTMDRNKGEHRTAGERKKGDKTLEKGQEISSGKKMRYQHHKSSQLITIIQRPNRRSITGLSVTTSRCCSRRDDTISMRVISRSTSCQSSLWKIPGCKSCATSSSATTSKWRITRIAVYRLFDFRCDVFDFLCIECK